MGLELKNMNQWESGEIALVALIAFLLVLLFIMLFCICRYGLIYHKLKKQELKPLMDGDGPYNSTARPNYQPDSTEDEDSDDDDNYDEEHNINLANKAIRKSFGASPLIHHKHNLMRYNTNTSNQSGSSESDTTTNNLSSDTPNDEDEDSDDTQTNLKRNRNKNHQYVNAHNDDDDDEDSDVRNRHQLHNQHLNQPQIRQYNNYVQHGHQSSIASMPMPMPYQGTLSLHIHRLFMYKLYFTFRIIFRWIWK